MEPWFAEAKRLPSLEVEAVFLLQPTFYYGPDSHPEVVERKQVEQLSTPSISRILPEMIRTSEAIGHETALAEYYKQIFELARSHGRNFNSIRQYFWLRLWMWNTQLDVHLSFPWYDSFSEIDRLLSALSEQSDDQLIFNDMDQGWEFEAYLSEGHFYFRQRDPDSEEVHHCVSVPREILLPEVRALRERGKEVIHQLSKHIGADVWSDYVRQDPNILKQANILKESPIPPIEVVTAKAWWKLW